MTGIAAYVTMTGRVFAVALNQPLFGLYIPIIITIAQLLGTFISIPLLNFELKWLNILGGFACGMFDLLAALFIVCFKKFDSFLDFGLPMTALMITAFMFTFGLTLGTTVGPYMSQMMPSGALWISQMINWVLIGVTLIAFSSNISSQGDPSIMLWVYAGFTLTISVLNCIFMIETKGKKVEYVQYKLAQD